MIAQLSNRRILIVGDIILDHYLIGRAERVSPEAPVMVLAHEQENYALGGAANVGLNIKSMEATPFLVSVIGADAYAEAFKKILAERHISADYLITDASRPTTLKTRILAGSQQLLRYDRESTQTVSETIEHQLFTTIETLIKTEKIEAIIFQDYNKGVLTPTLIQNTLLLAQKHQIPTITDPKKENFWAYRGVTLFKPNLREVSEALGMKISEKEISVPVLERLANQIREKLDNTIAAITLGAKGIFIQTSEWGQLVPTQPRAVADVCGAGDTVVSILALGLAANWSLLEIARWANLAGGQVCERLGVVAVDRKQLEKDYQGLILTQS